MGEDWGRSYAPGLMRYVVLSIDHLLPKEESGRWSWFNSCPWIQLLAPHIAARGDLTWEYNITEPPQDLWKIQGIKPPPFRSDAEKLWAQQNVPSAWEHGEQKARMNKGPKFWEEDARGFGWQPSWRIFVVFHMSGYVVKVLGLVTLIEYLQKKFPALHH